MYLVFSDIRFEPQSRLHAVQLEVVGWDVERRKEVRFCLSVADAPPLSVHTLHLPRMHVARDGGHLGEHCGVQRPCMRGGRGCGGEIMAA